MFGRIAGLLRTVLAALVLLCLLGFGAELWLRGRGFPMRTISSQVSDSLQILLEPSALHHHSLRPVRSRQVEAVTGRPAELRIAAGGLRGAAPVPTKTEDDYRILVLGDELVLGATVAEQATLPQRLQQFLSRVTEMRLEVLNAGLPGDCPQLALLRYQHVLRELRPDLVILHVDMSDVGDDAVYRSLLTEGESGEVCQHPALRPVTVAPSRYVQWLRESALAGWLLSRMRQDGAELLAIRAESCGQQDYGWIMDHADNLQLQIRHALAPIGELRKCVEADGGRLLVTTCPVVWQVVEGSHCPQATRRCRIRGATPFRSRLPFQSLAAVCAEAEVRLLDSSPRFLKDAEPARLFDSEIPSLSERGLAFYARLISDYIVANPPQRW